MKRPSQWKLDSEQNAKPNDLARELFGHSPGGNTPFGWAELCDLAVERYWRNSVRDAA